MNIVERERARRVKSEAYTKVLTMRPSTVQEPDRTTWYCDVATKRFQVGCCKILLHYLNGDCTVLAPNGVQFTARAEEVFNMRKGDYHETPDL